MDFELRKVMDYLGREIFYIGSRYPHYYVDMIDSDTKDDKQIFKFEVESNVIYRFYDVTIETSNHNIVHSTCNCSEFDGKTPCRHIAACLIYYRQEIFAMTPEEKSLYISEKILDKYYEENDQKTVKLKKQVFLEVELNFDFEDSSALLKFKIGETKLYNLNNKISSFLPVYHDKSGEVYFGKDFTYNPNVYFFSKEDEELLKFLDRLKFQNYNYLNGRNMIIDSDEIENFLDILGIRKFSVKDAGLMRKVERYNPILMFIDKEDKFYSLKIDKNNTAKLLTKDCKYAFNGDTFYIIPPKPQNILSIMNDNELNSLIFKEENLERFTKGIIPIFKENVTVEDKLKDKIIIGTKPTAKIYLDLKGNIILCNPKFDYRSEEIEYFDTKSKVIRDSEYEQEVIGNLLGLGFELKDKKIYMDDFESMGNFLENDLEKLATMYEVFTSNKIKETNIVKKNTIRSKFSIGSDNIMHYSFDLGNIQNDEIVNILNTIKNKKKYYRLKSGDFINLDENEDLKQLEALVEDMEIDDRDLINGTGEIPKYRAIYLDSIKKDKYNIVETDNMFDELINNFNSYKDASVKFSKKDKEILRDYQEIGVKWLYNIYKCGFGGILADEMGLGKSIQLIYLIKAILKEKKDAKILIVAPTSLIYNWQQEFDKFGSELKYKVLAENKELRKHELENLDKINVLITTYGLVRRDEEMYVEKEFELIALDEAQNIKNNNAQMTRAVKHLHAHTKLALTGTPLENSVLELWSIFDFIMPGYLANLLTFNRKYNIKDVDEENISVLDNLNKQIKPFILRRKKKDVVKELPDKLENNIFIDLNPEQKKIYVAELEKTQKELDEILKSEGFKKGNFKILQLLLKLRELCIDPSMVYENYKGGSAKIENLVSIVKDIISNGHKILLFTSFKMALDIVNREFTNNNISTYVIDGSVSSKKRMALVNKFNEDDTNVFLITLKSGGTGLNLTSADVVIHLDLWWNPQVENQATDRAHRIGQTKTVEVIKLICTGTIEEKILELQNKKKILSDKLIEGEDRDQNIISKLSEEDVKRLISLDNNDE